MPEPYLDPTRLLSIQSHVASGYVGNRAATFPLQLLGYDVDVINTVQFSNHTGYGYTSGHKSSADDLVKVFEGLQTNGLGRWARCLTGYVPGAEALSVVGKEIGELRTRAVSRGEEVVYLLDPVMGDVGKGLYVAQDVVPIYRSLLSQASIITPNQFETELLSETKITSLQALYASLEKLHSPPYNVPHVIISSIPLPLSLVTQLNLPSAPEAYTNLLPSTSSGGPAIRPGITRNASTLSVQQEQLGFKEKITSYIHNAVSTDDSEEPTVLVCFASSKPSPDSRISTTAYALPTIQGYYSGVGDLFSALVLGHYRPSSKSNTLPQAVSLALLGVQQVLLKTHLYTLDQTETPRRRGEESCIPSDDELDGDGKGGKEGRGGVGRKAKRMRMRELRIVQERELLINLGKGGAEGWKGQQVDWDTVLKE